MSQKEQNGNPRDQPRLMNRGPGRRGAVEKAKDPRGALRRLSGYLGVYKNSIIIAVIFTALSTLLNLAGPYLIGVAIDQYIIPRTWDGLLNICAIIAGVYILSSVIDITVGWIMADVSQKSLKKMRKDLFEHIQTLSLSFFDKTSSGDLMSRLTNDIDAIGSVLSRNLTDLTRSVLIIVGIIVAMFMLNTWLALASLIVFPFMIIFTAQIGKRARSRFRDLQQSMGRLNGVMQETITGQKAIISFWQQDSAKEKFRKNNTDVKEAGALAETYAMLVPPMVGIFSNANIAIVAGIGGWMALNGYATIGVISVFISYSRKFADPLRHFSNLYNSLQSAIAGAERVFEVLDVPPEIEDQPDAKPVDKFQGKVEFKDVEFSYVEDEKVIKDMSFEAEPGQMIAIVGPTGAGKTTMINILSRFYDIQSGSITIDEMNIINYRKDDLRRQLGVVLQDVFLFSGTVMDNIRYGRLEATDEEVKEAARLANADAFIRRLPNGYETELSERAGNLSQGQRQLLSIARAILADPSILILDEATSSVDTRTEIQIQEALLTLMENRTSFVIAHRLSTIRNADKVLVINKGEIVERGSHEELLEKKGYYYNLYMSQFKGTIDDEDFEYIKPVERPEHIQPQRGTGPPMRGGMGEPNAGRIMKMVDIFLSAGAVSPETAKTPEELGLPQRFNQMVTKNPQDLFLEHNGGYYISEENLKKMRNGQRK
ncbi:ATP-binding cassette domain-containing protein [Candidatus Bathyarchaeota archaeon]|nr:ATP-binding cassette domain-containing protein [Candidatus Bathyarchaeota archaeon]